MRENPFVQNQRFAIASRIRFAVLPAINELVAFVVLHGFCHGDGCQLSRPISVNVQPQACKHILELLALFGIVLDWPDSPLVLTQYSVCLSLEPTKLPSFHAIFSDYSLKTTLSVTCQHSMSP